MSVCHHAMFWLSCICWRRDSSKRIMKVVSTLWHIKAFALIFWTSEDEAPPNYWRGIILWCASRHCPLLTSTPPGARDQQAYWGGGYVLYGVDHHLSCRSGQDHLTQHSFQNVFPVESTTTQKALQPQPALLSCPLPHAVCHIWHVAPKASKRLKWRCIHIVQIIKYKKDTVQPTETRAMCENMWKYERHHRRIGDWQKDP